MRFLIDTNLPRSLCRFLAGKGHSAEHVLDLGLAQEPDIGVWRHALVAGACIVTKDRDFATLARHSGPQVLWLRTGNAPNRVTLAAVEGAWTLIEERLVAGLRLVECR